MAHGHYEGKDAQPPRDPRAVHARGAARERLVSGAARQARARDGALGAARAALREFWRRRATRTRRSGSASRSGSSCAPGARAGEIAGYLTPWWARSARIRFTAGVAATREEPRAGTWGSVVVLELRRGYLRNSRSPPAPWSPR